MDTKMGVLNSVALASFISLCYDCFKHLDSFNRVTKLPFKFYQCLSAWTMLAHNATVIQRVLTLDWLVFKRRSWQSSKETEQAVLGPQSSDDQLQQRQSFQNWTASTQSNWTLCSFLSLVLLKNELLCQSVIICRFLTK